MWSLCSVMPESCSRGIVLLMDIRSGSGRTPPGDRSAARRPANGDAAADSGGATDEAVRAQLDRLLGSTALRFSERLSRFLKFVVEQQLAGNAAQLKEAVLAIEIFDREATYDSRVDSVVRVEARRLRDKLDKYYSGEGRDDQVLIALPKGSYAPIITLRGGPGPGTPAKSAVPGPRGARTLSFRTVLAAAVVCVLATIVLTRWFGSRKPGPAPSLLRLTSDAGLTFQPALSMDGRLLAYASDRSGRGDLDIWLQQVPGGIPARLTESPADEVEPAFSPDGTLVAYRAEGEIDGIYVLPALGGKSTLLARGGYRPCFSPDGARVAYWTGERMFGKAQLFVVPVAGGTPAQLQPNFTYAAFPVWSPDGKHVAFVGSKRELRSGYGPEADDWDWWVAPVDGGAAISTSAQKMFQQQRLRPPETGWWHRRIIPYFWSSSGHIVFSARSGDQTNIWRVPVSARSWQVSGPAEQLTFGAGRQDHPSMAANGTLVFSALTHKSDVWSLPIDAVTAEPSGPVARLTAGPVSSVGPFVSRAGDRLVFLSNRSGNEDVWVRDLRTGREAALTSTRQGKTSAVFSPDGSKVAFGYSSPLAVFVVPFAGGNPVELCSDCGQPRAWLPDGTGLLVQRISSPGESLIVVLDPSGRETPLVRSSESALFSPSVSPDGKWMALVVRTPPSDHRVTVVPLRGASAAPRADWISVTEPGSWVDKPRWSPRGNVLYYVSDRDGFVCIWSRRLDPATKKPTGEPMAVIHFHNARNSLGSVYGLELSVGEDKLVFNLDEGSGNIWLAPAGR